MQQQNEAWEEFEWDSETDDESEGESAAAKRAAETQRVVAEKHVVSIIHPGGGSWLLLL